MAVADRGELAVAVLICLTALLLASGQFHAATSAISKRGYLTYCRTDVLKNVLNFSRVPRAVTGGAGALRARVITRMKRRS